MHSTASVLSWRFGLQERERDRDRDRKQSSGVKLEHFLQRIIAYKRNNCNNLYARTLGYLLAVLCFVYRILSVQACYLVFKFHLI